MVGGDGTFASLEVVVAVDGAIGATTVLVAFVRVDDGVVVVAVIAWSISIGTGASLATVKGCFSLVFPGCCCCIATVSIGAVSIVAVVVIIVAGSVILVTVVLLAASPGSGRVACATEAIAVTVRASVALTVDAIGVLAGVFMDGAGVDGSTEYLIRSCGVNSATGTHFLTSNRTWGCGRRYI